MLRFLIGGKSNKRYKDALYMGGNTYQVKPIVKCTENSREPVTRDSWGLFFKTHLEIQTECARPLQFVNVV